MTSDPLEIASWLRLTEAHGVGPQTCLALLRTFGLPEQIFSAGADRLGHVVSEAQFHALITPPDVALTALIARTVKWAAVPGNHFLTLADPLYPAHLLESPDPPTVLYVKGDAGLLNRPGLSIVGSRNATAQGQKNARDFAEILSIGGWTIVSGLALGIDAAAHEGGLAGAGSTVAVIGTGADIVYPARNRTLAHRIAERGAIVSEFPLGTSALPHHFPRRNRIIAALGRGVLVVEAAAQSGSLITARLAGDLGREVFAIPGSIHSPLSKGCHRLIRQGAKLVESAQDILEEFGADSAADAIPGADMPEDPVLTALGYDSTPLEVLSERTGRTVSDLASKLLQLELDGKIRRLPGGHFQRIS